ncbi:MAG TPA: hypothetical protein VIZ18_17430 [Ktedonobacteraceae bacterium]
MPQISNLTVQISKESIHLLRSISQPDKFISHIGVFRAGNCKPASSSLFTKKHNIWNKAPTLASGSRRVIEGGTRAEGR